MTAEFKALYQNSGWNILPSITDSKFLYKIQTIFIERRLSQHTTAHKSPYYNILKMEAHFGIRH